MMARAHLPAAVKDTKTLGGPARDARSGNARHAAASAFDFGALAVNGTALQRKLAVGSTNDSAEHEADRVSERVMRMPDAGPVLRRACSACENEEGKIRRKESANAEVSHAPSIVDDVLASPGVPLDAATRAFMEPRFGHDFSSVRVHTNERAAQSAEAVNARAYTVGRDIVFGRGAYAPQSHAGRALMAHELTHTVQQGGSQQRPLRRKWDKAETECAAAPQDRWITSIVVDQQTPQTVTLNWSSGSPESFQCSAGKGHCCVEEGSAGSSCNAGNSTKDGSNCTPITKAKGYPVAGRVLDHSGIPFWTEFEPNRAIALHRYAPVDGTPLSHGCVRLSEANAQRIFCSVKQWTTMVQVKNEAKPSCASANLQAEWANDFATAARSPDGEDADTQQNIRETRTELASAYGKSRPPEEYAKLTAKDIPRCVQRTVEEDRLTQPNTPGGVTGQSLVAGTPEEGIANQFATAYAATATAADAQTVTRQKGGQLWQTARASVHGSTTVKNDRPLYWARLKMATTIRTGPAPWKVGLAPGALQPAVQSQIDLLEQSSRGMNDVSFAGLPAGQKKILVTGFDPFQLDSEMRRSNPSGAAALDLDGQTLTAASGSPPVTGHVEAAVFPVRFADFDARMVEQFIGPQVNGPNPVDMVVTISQGGQGFELERYAGRRRSAGVGDNVGRAFGSDTNPVAPQNTASTAEFQETTTTPAQRGAMEGAGQSVTENGKTFTVTTDNHVRALSSTGTPTDMPGASAIAGNNTSVEGSGGGYLSNEIYYRAVSTVRASTHPTIPMIHLHTPALTYNQPQSDFEQLRTAIVQAVRRILTRVLPQL
jgi:pyrrolidone-carboxylate peptidase